MYRVYVYPSLIADRVILRSPQKTLKTLLMRSISFIDSYGSICVLAEAEAAPLTHATNY